MFGGHRFHSGQGKAAALGAITLLALGGMAGLFAVGHPHRYLFASLFLGASIPHIVTHVSLRYRYPTLGLTFLLGSDCLLRLWSAASRRFGSTAPRLSASDPGMDSCWGHHRLRSRIVSSARMSSSPSRFRSATIAV
jgi:hypothetical protein